jgi:hypothetical protein
VWRPLIPPVVACHEVGSSDDRYPAASRASAGYRQLGTDPARRAPSDCPAARRHPATGRADRRARSSAVSALPQLRSSPLFRSTVCEKALLLDHEGDSRSEAGTSWASPSVAGTYSGEPSTCGARPLARAPLGPSPTGVERGYASAEATVVMDNIASEFPLRHVPKRSCDCRDTTHTTERSIWPIVQSSLQ